MAIDQVESISGIGLSKKNDDTPQEDPRQGELGISYGVGMTRIEVLRVLSQEVFSKLSIKRECTGAKVLYKNSPTVQVFKDETLFTEGEVINSNGLVALVDRDGSTEYTIYPEAMKVSGQSGDPFLFQFKDPNKSKKP